MYTAAALAAANPVLLKGEIVYESDTRKFKIGDGVISWNDLPYDTTIEKPNSIPASSILQTDQRRMVSAEQISSWESKAAADLSNVLLTKNFTTNGYYKGPDGLLLQWGTMYEGAAASRTVYFPVTFLATPYAIVANVTPISSTGSAAISVVIKSKALSYFTATVNYATLSDAGYAKEGFLWLALGKWK